MINTITKTVRWLRVARELLKAEPFSREFHNLTRQAVERAVKRLAESLRLRRWRDKQ